jgi:hypothetical protein
MVLPSNEKGFFSIGRSPKEEALTMKKQVSLEAMEA